MSDKAFKFLFWAVRFGNGVDATAKLLWQLCKTPFYCKCAEVSRFSELGIVNGNLNFS